MLVDWCFSVGSISIVGSRTDVESWEMSQKLSEADLAEQKIDFKKNSNSLQQMETPSDSTNRTANCLRWRAVFARFYWLSVRKI